MPRTAARVTQADIARAIRAAKQAGAEMAVEIAPDGTIRLVPVPGDVKPPSDPRLPPLAKRKAPDL